MKLSSILALIVLVLVIAGGAAAGSIVWDFDSKTNTTTDLPTGAIDGDTLDPNLNAFGWGPDPVGGTINADFSATGGRLKQTYQALTSNALPPAWTSVIMTCGKISLWGGTTGLPVLNLPNAQTDYKYLIIKGKIGWSTNKDIGVYIFPDMDAFGDGGAINVHTNVEERQVFDLTTLTGYTGTLKGLGFLWFGNFWGPINDPGNTPSAPDYMEAQWTSEFNNAAATTFVDLDWVALTDNPDFRAEVTPPPTGAIKGIVWGFDGDTAGRPAGVIDGDTLVQFTPDPVTGTINAKFAIANDKLTQTYEALAEGATPPGLHDTSSLVGQSAWGTVNLNLTNCQTDYKYLVIKGTVGWSTNNPVGAAIWANIEGKSSWADVPIIIDNIATNSDTRQVFDLTALNGDYAGTLKGMLIDWYACWNPSGGAYFPGFMGDQWTSEFDNAPDKTFLNLDWVALTNDSTFGADGIPVPVELSEFTIFE